MKIPIGYCGQKNLEVDHLYGTDLVWEPGTVHEVDPKKAALLLRHPDVWFDTRSEDEQKKHPVPIATPTFEPGQFKYRQPESEDRREPPLINFDSVEDKGVLAEFAQKNYNIELDKRMTLANMKAVVRSHVQKEALGT